MKPEIAKRVAAPRGMTAADLREEYARFFGGQTRSRHKVILRKRIAWGLQAREEGWLSERARRRAEELARVTDLRLLAPKGVEDLSVQELSAELAIERFVVPVLPRTPRFNESCVSKIASVRGCALGRQRPALPSLS